MYSVPLYPLYPCHFFLLYPHITHFPIILCIKSILFLLLAFMFLLLVKGFSQIFFFFASNAISSINFLFELRLMYPHFHVHSVLLQYHLQKSTFV